MKFVTMECPKSLKFYSLLLYAIVVSACGGGEKENTEINFDILGVVQKGPFEIGSSVNVNFLDSRGYPTFQTIPTSTINNLGNFGVNLSEKQLVNIDATGYHWNELTDELSSDELTLNAIYFADGTVGQVANVNVLTHLIHQRVLFLIQFGAEASTAINTAQEEFVAAFQRVLPVESLPLFSSLSVYDVNTENSEGNAYLLALSATVNQYVINNALGIGSVDVELASMLNTMVTDFQYDGSFEINLLNDLAAASRLLRPNRIEENLKSLASGEVKEKLEVPDINQYIDTDGDGKVNSEDEDVDGDGITDSLDENPYSANEIDVQLLPPKNNDFFDTTTLRVLVTYDELVDKVEYLIDGELIGESTNAPYTFNWMLYYWADEIDEVTLSTQIVDVEGNISIGPSRQLTVDYFAVPPFILLPASGVSIRETNGATLSWEGLPSATKYQIQLWTNDSSDILLVDETITENSIEVTDLISGDYSWKVKAANANDNWGIWSRTAQINITGPVPPLIPDSKNSSIIRNSDRNTLYWDSVELATEYEIEVASGRNFENLMLQVTTTDSSFKTSTLSEGQFFWRVRSKNSVNNAGEWSVTTFFGITGPEAPQVVSPVENISVPSFQEVTFEWSEVDDVNQYEFQIADDIQFTKALISKKLSIPNSVTSLLVGRKYWRVRAINDFGFNGDWSTPRLISVGMFEKNYGGQKSDYASTIKQTEDGGYIIIGSTENFKIRNRGIYLLKIDAGGNQEWYKVFDTVDFNSGQDVIELSDGNFVLTGTVGSWPNTVIWLIKTSPLGDKISETIIANEYQSKLVKLDDGYLLGSNLFVSETQVNQSTYRKYVPKIVRYGLDDFEVWSHTFDESTTDFEGIDSIEVDIDGNFLISGSYDPTPEDLTNEFEDGGYIYHLSSDSLSSSYFILGAFSLNYGHIISYPTFDGSIFVVIQGMGVSYTLFDGLGNKIWGLSPGYDFSNAEPLVNVNSSEIEVLQYGERYINGNSNYLLNRLVYDFDGYTLKDEVLIDDGSSYERSNNLRKIISTSDGGYVLLGSKTISGNSDILVTKTDNDGNTIY